VACTGAGAGAALKRSARGFEDAGEVGRTERRTTAAKQNRK
jgi:hypothetical protein